MTARTPDILRQGALIVPDFVTPAEERRILERIAETPWIRDLNRRVQHYGFRYSYTNPGARDPAAPFPPWTEHMARRLLPHFGGAIPTQCIVNEYRPGHLARSEPPGEGPRGASAQGAWTHPRPCGPVR